MPFSCAQKRLESWWMFGRFVQWHLRGCASAKRQWSNSSAAFVMGGGVFELLGTVLVVACRCCGATGCSQLLSCGMPDEVFTPALRQQVGEAGREMVGLSFLIGEEC